MGQMRTTITREQFIEQYEPSAREMAELGQLALPCRCDYDGCEGWAYVSDSSRTYLAPWAEEELTRARAFRTELLAK